MTRVVVSTIGRFHSFDLARELHREGALVAAFSGYPAFKLAGLGVPGNLIHTFPWLHAPFMALVRYRWFQRHLRAGWAWRAQDGFDRHVARHLPDCDVVSALSTSGLHTGRAAKARGAAYVCDRGSAHIATQNQLLADEHERLGLPYQPIDARVIDKEQAEYALADAITLPSAFARDSFLARGVAVDKLRLVPYGVDLAAFRRTAPRDDDFRVLFVGSLSVRKGLHDLFEAFRLADLSGARLVLVGGAAPETEALLARHPVAALERLGHLDRAGVAREMSRASVLVLPSIEDGFGLVIAQALACGCPVIASTNTGGPDILVENETGFVVPIRAPAMIAEHLTRLHAERERVEAMGARGVERIAELGGWRAYGAASLAVFAELAARGAAAGSLDR